MQKIKIFMIRYIAEETFGRETESILKTASLWKRNVSAFIGPQVINLQI